MKKLMLAAAMGATVCAMAMPTREALDAARPEVVKLTAETVKKLDAGEMKPGEGAEALVALAGSAKGEAEKFLLLNAALKLQMRSGDIAGARGVVNRIKAEIKDITAEQLNTLMLEDAPNCIASWLEDDKPAPRGTNEWHVAKERVSRTGLTVKSLDELRKCGDRDKIVRLYLRGEKDVSENDLAGLKSVAELDLSETGLAEIPKSVFELTTLRRLWLARNPLKEVPYSIRSLKELVYLNLDGCPELARMPLEIVNMFDTRKGGKLRYLRLNGTKAQRLFYSSPDSRSGLRRLYARGSELHRLVRSAMIHKLDSVRGPYDNFMNCLEDLDIGETPFDFTSASGKDVAEYAFIGKNMKRLSFAGCKKLNKLPKILRSEVPGRDWSKLQVLDISDTPASRDKEELARIRREIGGTVTIIY